MVEARENILNILEESGVINRFKSELRSQVLKAMNKSLAKPEVLLSLQTPEAEICLGLVWDFLECAKLTNTLEIFVPECNLKRKTQRGDLEFVVGVNAQKNQPVLFSMLEKCRKVAPDTFSEPVLKKAPEKIVEKAPEVGNAGKKEAVESKNLNKVEPPKAVEKFSMSSQAVNNAASSLTSLPKPNDKANDRLKLMPLNNNKKAQNLKVFDVLVEDDIKPPKPEAVNKVKFDSPKSSIEEDIEEDDFEESQKEIFESQGTSSMGIDASVNSLALEEFDHIEVIRPPARKR